MSSTEDRLRRLMYETRQNARLSQEDVAKRLGVTTRTYGRWERGESQLPLKRMGEIARALGVPASQLTLDRTEELAARVKELEGEVGQLNSLVQGIFDRLIDRNASKR